MLNSFGRTLYTENTGALTAGQVINIGPVALSYTDAGFGTTPLLAVVDTAEAENCFCDDVVRVTDSSILPVEFVSFEAEEENCLVELSWTTATETNNKHFVVQRSANGLVYENIGIVEGSGTSAVARSYSFVDSPQAGVWIYRLEQVDFDGATEYSDLVQVTTNCVNEKTVLSPNPARTSTTLNYTAKTDGELELRIVNMSGQLVEVKEVTVNAGDRINELIETEGYTPGVYALIIVHGSLKETLRFVKL